MSQVKLTKRSKSDEAPRVAAKELAKYTMQICKNKKNFPEEYDFFVKRLIDLTLDIHHEITIASSFRSKRELSSNILNETDRTIWLEQHYRNIEEENLDGYNDKQKRHYMQYKHITIARGCLYDFIDLVDIAIGTFDIDSKRVQYWMGLTSKVLTSLEFWSCDLTG